MPKAIVQRGLVAQSAETDLLPRMIFYMWFSGKHKSAPMHRDRKRNRLVMIEHIDAKRMVVRYVCVCVCVRMMDE